MRPGRILTCGLLALLLAMAGCGSGGEEKPKGTAGGDAAATPAEDASKDAPQADADGLVEVTQAGVTLKVPATWKLDKDTNDGTLFIWVNPKCKRCGLVALDVQNTTQTAEEFVTQQKSARGSWHNLVKRQAKVQVEGLGEGYRVHVVDRNIPIDYLVVSAMDGLLVEVTSVHDEDHPEYPDLVLSSVKRTL